MTINSINGANTQMGQMGMNSAMTLEEKMKKRQEIQEVIICHQ